MTHDRDRQIILAIRGAPIVGRRTRPANRDYGVARAMSRLRDHIGRPGRPSRFLAFESLRPYSTHLRHEQARHGRPAGRGAAWRTDARRKGAYFTDPQQTRPPAPDGHQTRNGESPNTAGVGGEIRLNM